MKFDPTKWQEIKPNEAYQNKTGRLSVMCSETTAALYVTAQGLEALAGVGAKIDVASVEAETFKVTASDDARVFVYLPHRAPYAPVGEVFTNLDRKPMESGSVLEVTRAIRAFKIEMMQERRALLDEARRVRKAKPPTELKVSTPTEEVPADAEPDETGVDAEE